MPETTKFLRWVVQAVCRDTDLDVHTGRGDIIAIVEMYIPIEPCLNDYGMKRSSCVLNDKKFEQYSMFRSLRGDQLTKLQSGEVVQLTRQVKVTDLSVESIRKAIQAEWSSQCVLINSELERRYKISGLCEWEE